MTHEEILSLPSMTEEEQIEWLAKNGILKRITGYVHYLNSRPDRFFIHESLADCAFRLRDETLHFASYLKMVRDDNDNCDVQCWGLTVAKPIHWICAALLAKLEPKSPEATGWA